MLGTVTVKELMLVVIIPVVQDAEVQPATSALRVKVPEESKSTENFAIPFEKSKEVGEVTCEVPEHERS